MTTSSKTRGKWTKDRQFVIDLATWSALICGSLVLLGILVGTNVVNWDWITGFVLAAFFSTIALWLIRISVKEMVRTQNHIFFVFLFVARLGLYFIPFLMGAFISDFSVFSIWGILIGMIPLAVVPLSGMIPALITTFSKKERALSRANMQSNR